MRLSKINRIREITVFLNPTNESYSRLGRNCAPDRINWSSAGESELIYIETYKGRTRAELRSPDASGNPYLVYALLIYAGLEGIEQKMELSDDVNMKSVLLPGSLREAAEFARESDFVKELIPEGIVRKYVER